jgi:hypothetical protein
MALDAGLLAGCPGGFCVQLPPDMPLRELTGSMLPYN